MRKVTKTICQAFIAGEERRMGNGMTDGKKLFLFGNLIAEKTSNGLVLRDAGWKSVTTKRWLNGLLDTIGGPFMLYQKKGQWYIWNGCDRIEWEGSYTI